MANTILTTTKIAREAIVLLKNRLGVANKVHRDYISEMYDPKTGGTVTVRKPAEFSVTSGATLSNQDATEYSVVIPAPSQKHVAFRFSSAELTHTIEEFSRRYVAPAVTQLANQVDEDLLALYTQFPHTVGLPGTTPNAWSYIGNTMQKMDEMGVPQEDRCLCINPAARNKLADSLKGLFAQGLTEDAIRRGELGRLGLMELMMTQNVANHTTGTFSTGSTPLANGTVADGATTIVTDGWANSTAVLKAGDVFTVASVNEVNPRNKNDLGYAKQFVAQADVTSDGSGNATITVMDSTSSGMQDSGAFQNVSAHVQNNAAITVWGNSSGLDGAGTEGTIYPANFAFHRNALALVFFNIETPASADGETVSDPDSGLSVRLIRDYDVTNDREVYRLDVLYSVDVLHPDMGVRLIG